MPQDKEQPLARHFEELRRRLTICAIALVLGTGIAFSLHRVIIRALLHPASNFANTPGGQPVFTELTEFVGIAMKVSFYGGVVLALPVVLYQLVMFIAPGLTPRERRYLYALFPLTILAFAGGVAFGYFILLPPALDFLLSFGSDLATPMIRIGNYINLIVTLLFWIGVTFETPLVMFFLAKIGVVTPAFLARQRRIAFVGAFILGAIITPTFDPVNQTLMAVPIIVLYELGIWLSKLARPNRKPKSQTSEKLR